MRIEERFTTQNPLHDPPMDIGEAEVAAGMAIGKALVVESHEVQNRRVQIVYMDLILDCEIAVVVRRSVDGSTSDAPTGQPHGKPEWVVIATSLRFGTGRAPEFATPDRGAGQLPH